MKGFVRTLILGLALVASPTAQTSSATPQTPQQQAIEQVLKDAEAARLKADFAGMQAKGDDAVRLSRAAGDEPLLSRALTVVAQSFFFRAQPALCLPAAEEAAAIVSRLDAPSSAAVIANTLATCLRGVGRFEEAIDWYNRSAEFSRIARNLSREAVALSNVAQVYIRLGEAELATRWAGRAVERARESADPQPTALAFQVLGNARGLAGDLTGAVAAHHDALAAIDRMPASPFATLGRIEEFTNIGLHEYLLGRYDDARRTLTETLDITRVTPHPLAGAVAGSYLGWTALTERRLDDAEQAFVRARSAWSQVDDTDIAGEMLMTEIGYARLLRARGRSADALAVDLVVLQSLERLRIGRNVTSTSSATSLLTASRAYVDAIDLLIGDGRIAEAYDVSERYRARTFLDAIDEQKSGIGRAMTDAQRAKEKTLAGEATKAQVRLWDTTIAATERATLQRRLVDIDDELAALRREVRRQDPRYGAVHFPVLLTADAVRRSLDANTAMLSFVIGDTRSFVFAVTSAGVVAAPLPAQAALEPRIAAYRQLIAARPAAGTSRLSRLRADAAALTSTLLAPVAAAIRGKTRLVVITDGALNGLPFEALGAVPTAGATARATWLSEQAAISYAPSASALAAITADAPRANGARVLAVGDPDFTGAAGAARQNQSTFTALPFTRVEVQRIGRLFADTTTLVGAAATPDAFTRAPLDSFRYIHLATHAFVNTVRPGRSGIALSAGGSAASTGILLADDVTKLALRADLVTLSACETGLGRSIAGEGVMGLARAFLIAGSKSVAASLWNVNDEATATLMERFYTQLKAGKPRDEALSAARRALISGSDTRLKDPYYWAPFILIGSSN